MITISHIFINDEIKKMVNEVLFSHFLVQGKKVTSLEEELTKLTGTKYAVLVNSGTAALHTAMASLNLQKDDEVITTSFSFIATANAILMCGARPVFVDIKENTFTIDPALIEEHITKKTKAILTVDLYGQPCDYEAIRKIARKHKLKIVSDSCQAIGAEYKNKPIGYWADITCFSFYATKNISMGEGGALVTNNKNTYNFAKRFRQHGQDMERPYIYHHVGYNYRATDILASIALLQMNFLKKWNLQRNKNAHKLITQLKDVPGIIIPIPDKDKKHVFHQFTIRVTKKFHRTRNGLKDYLLRNGVQTGIYYPSILPEQNHIKKLFSYKKNKYPISQKISKEVLSLPVHPFLKESDINKIASLIKKVDYEKR